MRLKKSLPIIFLICSLNCNLWSQNGEPIFSADQLKADLQYVQNKLTALHPNLYLYSSKAKLDLVFDSLAQALEKPLSSLDFYNHLAVISSMIKDGHTLILPSQASTDFHHQNSLFFPYTLIGFPDQLLVSMVCTQDNALPEGAEIISINEVSAASIIEQMLRRQVRDGNNLSYPSWILNNYFREYYSYVFGHPKSFVLKYRQENIVKIITINGLPKDSINYYRQLKYPNRLNKKLPGEGIKYVKAADNSYAVLTIKDFHQEVLQKVYQQHFKREIDQIFSDLQVQGTGNLILDLRDNQGGELLYGLQLLSYLMDKPFTVVDSYFQVDPTKSDHQLKKTNGQALGLQQPQNLAFKGKLYVLINGGSFSNSGIVAACLKRNNRAVFIGDETGGNNQVLAGYVKDLTLPNTGIQIQIPTKQFLLDAALPLVGRGTLPNHSIRPNMASIIKNQDPILDFAIDLIRNEK
jgi:hypothetical protein